MTWRLAGDEDSRGFGAPIECLMLLAGGDFEAFSCMEDMGVIFDFEVEFAFEDEEELVGADVGVALLRGAWWHELFDDAEVGGFDQVPAVAVGSLRASPLVVLRRFFVDDLSSHLGLNFSLKELSFAHLDFIQGWR